MQTPQNENQAAPHLTLVAQVEARRAELTRQLTDPANSAATRADIEGALATLPSLLTGDLENLPDMVSRGLIRWLESSKYLGVHGDAPPPVAPPEPTIKAEDTAQPVAAPPVLATDVSART